MGPAPQNYPDRHDHEPDASQPEPVRRFMADDPRGFCAELRAKLPRPHHYRAHPRGPRRRCDRDAQHARGLGRQTPRTQDGQRLPHDASR